MALASSSFSVCLARASATPVLSAGDPEQNSEVERRANGISIDDTTWGEILEVAKANGVSAEQIEGIVG